MKIYIISIISILVFIMWFTFYKIHERQSFNNKDYEYILYLQKEIELRDSIINLHFRSINRIKAIVGLPIDSSFSYKNKIIHRLE